MHGQISQVEIPADDTGKALDFYSTVFGWSFEAMPGGPFEYHVARTGETGGVAITNMEPGKHGSRPYFDVDDVDASAAKVRELGGEASERHPVPNMGWFVTCTDPHGNEFGLWQTDSSAA
jgi:predicted enzyme related to lactoylglutathione lyase